MIVAIPVLQFALAGVAALVIVGLAVSVASRRVGEREAIVDARSEALAKGQAVVQPAVTDALLKVDPDTAEALDKIVRKQVLSSSIVRVKIWRADGTILYSDEERLIGARYPLGAEEVEALRKDRVQAEVSDLQRPENRFERPAKKLLEVYLPIRTPDGTRVLFETYFRYDAVVSSGQEVWRAFAPLSLGSLVILELVQIPLAWGLARRLRRRQIERERLLDRAIGASAHERRRIAADLHDGVVQDLAGVSYALAAAARQPDGPSPEALDSAAASVRSSIEALRTLLVEIYPPDLAQEGLAPAIDDLLSRATAAGVETHVDTSTLAANLPRPVAELLYRTVQEALRNVVGHASATNATVSVGVDGSSAFAEVVDDGSGFDVEATSASRPDEGHVGLRGLRDLAGDVGGRLTIRSAPGAGTTIRMEVPIR
ncbi:MAG: two-component sensor histidine kinase [Acidimicrobiales bacterium]|nr:two-component sensor histidine kinase [Acidimicrobiales bacterium]